MCIDSPSRPLHVVLGSGLYLIWNGQQSLTQGDGKSGSELAGRLAHPNKTVRFLCEIVMSMTLLISQFPFTA
jgi:hypothetical protein